MPFGKDHNTQRRIQNPAKSLRRDILQNSQRLKAVNYFHKGAQPGMFDRALNTSPIVKSIQNGLADFNYSTKS